MYTAMYNVLVCKNREYVLPGCTQPGSMLTLVFLKVLVGGFEIFHGIDEGLHTLDGQGVVERGTEPTH